MLLRSNFSSFPHYFVYIFLTSGVKLHIRLLNVVVQFIVFLTLSTLICRSTDISKCSSESLGIRDNESRLYIVQSQKILLPESFTCIVTILYSTTKHFIVSHALLLYCTAPQNSSVFRIRSNYIYILQPDKTSYWSISRTFLKYYTSSQNSSLECFTCILKISCSPTKLQCFTCVSVSHAFLLYYAA